jgi:hypothetical protein
MLRIGMHVLAVAEAQARPLRPGLLVLIADTLPAAYRGALGF